MRKIHIPHLEPWTFSRTNTRMRSPASLRAHFAAIVAWLATAGVRSRAQSFFEMTPHADCSVSDLSGYDWKAEPLGSGLSLHWSISAFDNVDFEAVSIDADVGWLSIAFSADGNMIGSDAVVGAAGQVLEYYLGSKSLPVQLSPTTEASISPFSEQEITNAALERVENSTSLSFTRPITPKSVGKQPLFPDSGGELVTLLWAAGPGDTFGYHFLGRGAFTVDLLCADGQPAVELEQPFATPDPEIVATQASSLPSVTAAPSISPPEILAFTVSPTSAPTSPFTPQPFDGRATSGAPGLMNTWGDSFGVCNGFARAIVFGLLSIVVSTTLGVL